MNTKVERKSVKINGALYERLRVCADRERRKICGLLDWAVEEFLEKRKREVKNG